MPDPLMQPNTFGDQFLRRPLGHQNQSKIFKNVFFTPVLRCLSIGFRLPVQLMSVLQQLLGAVWLCSSSNSEREYIQSVALCTPQHFN